MVTERLQDLAGGGPPVDLGVGGVLELLGHEVVRVLAHELLGRPDGAGHPLDGRGEMDLGPEAGEVVAEPTGIDLPDSVIGFLDSELGGPPAGGPEPFRTKVLAGRDGGRATVTLTGEQRAVLAQAGVQRRELLNDLLFPGPYADRREAVERWGDVSVVPTRPFLYGLEPGTELEIDLEPGVRLLVELEALSDADDRGYRTAHISLNGQLRPVEARDRTVEAQEDRAEKADPAQPGHVAAPLTGVVTVQVDEGEQVEAGQAVASIEAMKMESTVSAGVGGRVERVVTSSGKNVEPGDLLLVIAPD